VKRFCESIVIFAEKPVAALVICTPEAA